MKKILELDPNLFISIGLISMCIGGIWMSYAEEKNLIQLGLIVLGGLLSISGGIIGFIQNRKIIKESKDQWNASGSNSPAVAGFFVCGMMVRLELWYG